MIMIPYDIDVILFSALTILSRNTSPVSHTNTSCFSCPLGILISLKIDANFNCNALFVLLKTNKNVQFNK